MSEETFKIEITGPATSIIRNIPEDLVQQIISAIFSGNPKPFPKHAIQEKPHQTFPQKDHGVELSVREFVNMYEPKRTIDFIATFGLFLKEKRSESTFKRQNLIDCFEDAGESAPANLSRDISWAIKTGWIAVKNGVKNEYFITNSGTNAVHEKFTREVKQKTTMKQKKRKKQKAD